MKRIVRHCTFETNSSSTHSLVFMSKENFKKWKNGELYKEQWSGDTYTQEEYDSCVNNYNEYERPQTFEEWIDDSFDKEWYEYTTPRGDEIVAVCKYGSEY